MKKLICIILLAMSCSLSFTSCTEEVVTPSTTDPIPPTGGNGQNGKI